jgi:hypothetical protein
MAKPEFVGSRTKLLRSRKFIDELADELETFYRNSPISARYRTENGEHVLNLHHEGFGPMPGAILGDVVHNLRTSLDQAASEMARLRGQRDKNVYFPFSDSADTLDEQIKRKNFDRCGPQAVGLIKSVKPYPGGHELLRFIHDLDIQDKHTSLLVMGLSFQGMANISELHPTDLRPIKANVVACFQEGTPAALRPVMETLERIHDATAGIIDAFAMLDFTNQ